MEAETNPNQGVDVIEQALRAGELARVNVTYGGQNGDLVEPVNYTAADAEVKAWVTEAVRTGGIPGVRADVRADFSDYVVDRFAPTQARPFALLQLRPKTPYG